MTIARPALMSAPMVCALLDDRKGQTRRTNGLEFFSKSENEPDRWWCSRVRDGVAFFVFDKCPNEREVKCPYGKPGDLLWVRETFQPFFADGFDHNSTPAPDWKTGLGYTPRYVATDGATEWIDGDDNITSRCKPSIHMPRWASRLTLRLTDVRVERLQDISETDAIDEGVLSLGEQWARKAFAEYYASFDAAVSSNQKPPIGPSPSQRYAALWDQINSAGSWAANPRVWALTFDVIKANVDQVLREAA